MAFFQRAGELEPMEITCTRNGAAPLVAAASAVLRWTRPDGTTADVPLVVVNAAGYLFRRDWVAGDTDQVGTHRGVVIVTRTDGQVRTHPNDGQEVWWFVTE